MAKKTEKKEETKSSKSGKVKSKVNKQVTSGRVYVTATFNNTLVTITDDAGNTLYWGSSGAAGFKGAFSTDGGSISKDKEFHNDRICVEGALSQKEFETLITKEGIFFNRLFIKLLHIKVSILELWKADTVEMVLLTLLKKVS